MCKEIPLTQGLFSIVDDEDYPELNRYKWYADKCRNTFYARRWIPSNFGRNHELMHCRILSPKNGLQIDHINGNGLDNRKENLRVVTNRQNTQNRHVTKTSKYAGVHTHNLTGKWRSQILFNGKIRSLGLFNDEIDAATTYRVACAVLIGGD
jgi:hypothetical protein